MKSESPPAPRRRSVIVLGMIALATLAFIVSLAIPRGGARRAWQQPHPHEMTVVRVLAPHLGSMGGALLARDCGRCHAPGPNVATAPVPPPLPPPSPSAPPVCPGAGAIPPGAGARSCISCHTPAKGA